MLEARRSHEAALITPMAIAEQAVETAVERAIFGGNELARWRPF
jgi:hypothetical protein